MKEHASDSKLSLVYHQPSTILSLAARRKGIARCAALHLDCARSAKGRSVSVAFEELLLVPK